MVKSQAKEYEPMSKSEEKKKNVALLRSLPFSNQTLGGALNAFMFPIT